LVTIPAIEVAGGRQSFAGRGLSTSTQAGKGLPACVLGLYQWPE
jgi:hypothetical protein